MNNSRGHLLVALAIEKVKDSEDVTPSSSEEIKENESLESNFCNNADELFGILDASSNIAASLEKAKENADITTTFSVHKQIHENDSLQQNFCNNAYELREVLEASNDIAVAGCSGVLPDKKSIEKSPITEDFAGSDDSVKDPDYDSDSTSTSGTSSSTTSGSTSSSVMSNVGHSQQAACSSDQQDNEVKGKKRRKRESEWKRNLAKKLRNSGKPYKSSNKALVRGREIKPPCNQKCKLKCLTKFTEHERKIIFDAFWNLGNLQRQRDFIANSMQQVTPRYRYQREGSTRQPNNAFYFQHKNKRIRICKVFFKNTLDINDRPIRTVLKKQKTDLTNIIETDLRGKHQNHKKVDEEIKEGVRKHISLIPKIESHYTRANTSRHFIDGSKTVADIYRDYVAECKKNNLPTANYIMFYRIFNQDYNISFFTPKKDQCELCVAYTNAAGDDKTKLHPKYEQHLIEKDLARKEKECDKGKVNNKVIVACYDLQAVFQCPKGDISVFYYKSKLNVLNLTFYEMKTSDVSCYIWHEGEGERGVNEIGTCVFKFIEKKAKSCDEELEIIFYTDNCGGQQKNRFMISVYMYAISKFENIKSITHKYLITGHTQNEGDSVHSMIEKQVKRTLKSGPIYTPDQFISIVRASKKQGPPYQVIEMAHQEFLDIKDLCSQILCPLTKNTDNEVVKISDFKIIKVDREFPTSCFYKTSYLNTEFKEFSTIKTKKRGSGVENGEKQRENVQLKNVFTRKPRITERKKADLMDLLRKNHIPKLYQPFYDSL